MSGPKRTASAAATLAFGLVPLPLAPGSHPAKRDRSRTRPASLEATKTPPAPPTNPAPAPPTNPAPAPPTNPAPAPPTNAPPAPPTGTWTDPHAAHVQHDVRLRGRALASPKPSPARRPRAHVAGDPTNTITDFKFSPGTTTIHVGDTVTWTNSGPSPHTATAHDGSFDTGTLAKGASASHTFTRSGSFAYICTVHPFMKGTVVVLSVSTASPSNSPSTTATAPSTTAGSAAGAPATNPGASNAPTLPVTGLDAPVLVAVGLGLLALGKLVRPGEV